MSCRKRRRWHFRDPKFKTFLGEHASRLTQVWGAFGALTSLPLCATSKSHATLLITGNYGSLWNQCPRMEEETWCRRGWGGAGGGGGSLHFKNRYCQGGCRIFIYNIFLGGGRGGKGFIHHTFLNSLPPPPPWNVIKVRSLAPYALAQRNCETLKINKKNTFPPLNLHE